LAPPLGFPSFGVSPPNWLYSEYRIPFDCRRLSGTFEIGGGRLEKTTPNPTVINRLKAYFHRNGYVRRVDAVRRVKKGHLYKKGAEVRLVAQSEDELADIRDLLKSAGFKLARPFDRAQPVAR
jgi:hypothetical protein